jgi:tRNA (guanine37-N1)-methyltransferase
VCQQRARRLRFDVLTLFPEVFGPALKCSILGLAAAKGLVDYHLHDIRDYSEDKHHKVDDRPYGGGPGMVIRCEPVFRACEAVRDMAPEPGRLILLTPQGRRLDDPAAREYARADRLVLLCGHYEGFDERISLGLPVEEVSIGDYVLSGGEVAAMVVIDAVVRLLPGALGHEDSAAQDSFANGLLDYPQYTRPPEFRGMRVPDLLLGGNHAEIEAWRRAVAAERTGQRRADLLHKQRTEHSDG